MIQSKIKLTLATVLMVSMSVMQAQPINRSVIKNKHGITTDISPMKSVGIIVKFKADKSSNKSFENHSPNDTKIVKVMSFSASQGLNLSFHKTNALGAAVFRSNKILNNSEVQNLAKSILASDSSIEYVEPDYLFELNATPNDTLYASEQWHYKNSPYGAANLPFAWDISTGVGVTVAVLDTGYRPHADLAANILPGYDFVSTTSFANDGDGRDASALDPGDAVAANECATADNPVTPAETSSWHGTHVAGTVAALTNNGTGVAGVAYSSKILPIRVLGKCGGASSDIADGILWAAGWPVAGVPSNPNPAKVINLSLGGIGVCQTSFQQAIDIARSQGASVVVAAGNFAVNNDTISVSPANCLGVISVAAVGKTGYDASYSNYGTKIKIAAPGGDTDTTYHGAAAAGLIHSTYNSGTSGPSADNYVGQVGTSMASPHVAGVAALLYALKPASKPNEIENILRTNVKGFPGDCTYCAGTGILDAHSAVTASKVIGNRTVKAIGDFNGDGTSDVLWQHFSRRFSAIEFINNASSISSAQLIQGTSTAETIMGAGDFNGDGKDDIVWRNMSTGAVRISLMNGATVLQWLNVGTSPIALNTKLEGIGDFDGNGRADMLWRNQSTGRAVLSYHNADGSVLDWPQVSREINVANVTAMGIGDINGDGKSDIVWRNMNTGNVVISFMNGNVPAWKPFGVISLNTAFEGIGDFNGDGRADTLWRNKSNANTVVVYHNPTTGTQASSQSFPNGVQTSVTVNGFGDFNNDGKSDILWRSMSSGNSTIDLMNGATPQRVNFGF